MLKFTSILALFVFSTRVLADVYLHHPRGCNNRLDEQNRERANGNRMCDTQNNNRGGYNVGKMIYYHKEKIPVDWTNQHGASKYQMENSEFVLQYMCDNIMRDGTTTRTIPIKATECYNYDCDTDVRFGRHESFDNYQMCTKTRRNEGLFTINQNLQGESAKYTRQNPQGTRFAYECPEERDHYPYWRPSDWIDAMIVTADPSRCAKYQAESQNVKERYECRMPDAFFDNGGTIPGNFYYAITQDECEAQTLSATDEDGTTEDYTAEWNTIPAHGVDPPECKQVAQTRANHLGNPGGRTLYGTDWEIPETIPEGSICVMRIRYNITTADYLAWDQEATLTPGIGADMDSTENKPNPNKDPAECALWEYYGLDRSDVEESFNDNDADSREYVLKNNPQPNAFGALLDDIVSDDIADNVIKMQLAVNTAQFGRTFQDRSHTFIVEARPDDIPEDAKIVLQTVRGKRGNIVQTYPATEYFMHPENLWARQGDYVHFQWTGSNTNPNNNDGQGKQGTDRTNMVAQRVKQYDTTEYSNFDWDMTWENDQEDEGSSGTSYPGYVKKPDRYDIPDQFMRELNEQSFGGIDEQVRVALALGRKPDPGQHMVHYGNMEELDDSGTTFNLRPHRMDRIGCTNFLCTRNNNFSNRAQKGKFCIAAGDVGEVMVSEDGAEWCDSDGSSCATIWPGSVKGAERVHIVVHYDDDPNTATVKVTDVTLTGPMTVRVAYTPVSLNKAELKWQAECQQGTDNCDLTWHVVDHNSVMIAEASVAEADVQNTGTFKVVHKPNPGPIIALTIAIFAFTGALAWVLLNKCGDRCPKVLQRFQVSKEAPGIQATGGPPPFNADATMAD